MCMIQGFRKFVPGEVWSFDIDTEALDSSWRKFRPYLIIGANNRRIVVLKMTHGGENASNWIYQLDTGGEQKSRIILDCPITVDISKVIEGAKKQGSFTHAMFLDIYRHHRAAMDAHALDEDCFLDVADIEKINDIRRRHEDRLMCFSKYIIQYEDDEVTDEVEMSETEEKGTEATDISGTVEEVVEAEVKAEQKEEPKAKVIDISEKPKTTKTTLNPHCNQTIGRRGNIVAEDIFIFSKGRTTREDCIKELERVGFTNASASFIMNDLKNRGKVIYLNNRYNVTLKHTLLNPSNGSKLPIKTYLNDILSDVDEIGIKNTAMIWGRTYTAIHKTYTDHLKESAKVNTVKEA